MIARPIMIMGFQVAVTPLTQRYIHDLVAEVMHTASFFGFYRKACLVK